MSVIFVLPVTYDIWRKTDSFTPNNTYNQLKNSPISIVVKSAGNKTSESYEDAIIDR